MSVVHVKKYNPLEMSNDDILALATGREKLLDIMLTEMKVCLKPRSNQHFVLHGPRGIGKSFFTKLLKIHHDQSDDFKDSLFYQLPEEQENINFASDLLDVIATLLEGGKLVDTAPRWTISDIQWQRSKQRLRDAIATMKKNGINHVFVTQENLQAFIPKLDKMESSRLRDFLSDFDEVTIIGSSLRPDLDNDYSKRLFQVFKKLDIEPWTADDFITYYDKLAQRYNYDNAQLENLKKSKNKIKAISLFTGGSPRLAVILSKLILEKNILDTAELLDGIIDELTTYYQDITNDIPAKSKILFDMLIRKGENMTQSSLAAAFEPPLEQKDIARSFAWLTDNYYVISSKQARGNTKYFYVRDRLYVLYYQKRQIYADVPFSFVGVFVDFLNAFYTKKEKVNELKRLDLNHAYAKPFLNTLARKEGLKNDDITVELKELKDKIINHLQKIKNIKSTLNNNKKLNDFRSVNKNRDKEDFKTDIDFYKKIIDILPENNEIQSNLGRIYYEKGDYDNAIIAFEKALNLDPENSIAYINLGMTYARKGDIENAIRLNKEAITLDPKISIAYINLGLAYDEKGDFEKAIMYYKIANSLNPKDSIAYVNLGISYVKKGDLNNAISAFEKAIDLDPSQKEVYNNLGIAYAKKGDIEKAIKLFEKAIDFEPNNGTAYINLGNIYFEKSEYNKSITAYKKAITLNHKIPQAYNNLGIVYNKKGDHEKAISILLNGLKSNVNDLGLIGLGLMKIINHRQWSYLIRFHTQWKGDKPFSSILGESLYIVIKYSPDNKFYHFKNTIDTIRNFDFININEVINGLCIGLYKDGDMDFLRQVVDELSHDFADDAFVQINLEVYKYLLSPERYDIHQLHPDVRTVVESILDEEKELKLKTNPFILTKS